MDTHPSVKGYIPLHEVCAAKKAAAEGALEARVRPALFDATEACAVALANPPLVLDMKQEVGVLCLAALARAYGLVILDVVCMRGAKRPPAVLADVRRRIAAARKPPAHPASPSWLHSKVPVVWCGDRGCSAVSRSTTGKPEAGSEARVQVKLQGRLPRLSRKHLDSAFVVRCDCEVPPVRVDAQSVRPGGGFEAPFDAEGRQVDQRDFAPALQRHGPGHRPGLSRAQARRRLKGWTRLKIPSPGDGQRASQVVGGCRVAAGDARSLPAVPGANRFRTRFKLPEHVAP